jgi:hypothetical protein
MAMLNNQMVVMDLWNHGILMFFFQIESDLSNGDLLAVVFQGD